MSVYIQVRTYRSLYLACLHVIFLKLQKSLNTTLGDDEYTSARKEVLTHMCSRPMQVRAH